MEKRVLTHRAGPVIQLTRYSLLGIEEFSYIIPYKDNFTLTTQQDINQPVQELYEWLKDSMMTSSDFVNGSTPGIIDGIDRLQDLLGFKLNNKNYYASAWKGTKPSQLGLNLEFTRGIAGEWNSKKEVYDPILEIYSKTVPDDSIGDLIITGPVPSALSVLASYGASMILNALELNAKIAEKAIAKVSSELYKGQTNKDLDLTSAIQKAQNAVPNNLTWKVTFGYSNGTSAVSPIFVLDSLIVESSTFEFGTEVEHVGSNYYPTSGSLTLSLKNQIITTSSTITKNIK